MNIALLATVAFCRIVTQTTIEYAPDMLCPMLTPPTPSQYLAAGWLENRIISADTRDGYYATLDHYEARDGAVFAVYNYEQLPKPVTRYSKLKIYGAIAQMGAWDAVETWLKSKTINGLNGWVAFQLAQEIADDHPLFEPLANEAKSLLFLTDEQFDALLSQCVLDI